MAAGKVPEPAREGEQGLEGNTGLGLLSPKMQAVLRWKLFRERESERASERVRECVSERIVRGGEDVRESVWPCRSNSLACTLTTLMLRVMICLCVVCMRACLRLLQVQVTNR